MTSSITLYTMSWNGYWEKYGKQWAIYINKLNTVPDEILVISDKPIDTSYITITNNIKNIVLEIPEGQQTVSYYRNAAAENASSDWIVASDIDDEPFQNYIDSLDDSADIHAFAFTDGSMTFFPDHESLQYRLSGDSGNNLIPGTSAIKKSFFKNIKYENYCYEDKTFYSMSVLLKPKLSFDKSVRFLYSGFNSYNLVREQTSARYKGMIDKSDRDIFICWFSDTISDNRKNALRVLARSCGVKLRLITRASLYDYENQEIPIHKGFQFLTDTDKSDYARAYLMYFYGGGYSDIKANTFDWNPYFDELLRSKYDAIGYAENNYDDVANFWNDDQYVDQFIKNNYQQFAGNGHFIFKPRTRFAYDWIKNIHKLMDDAYDQLKSSPGVHPYMVKGGFHGGYYGEVPEELKDHSYPFDWTTIGGTTRHKLEYEYGLNVFKKGMPFPNMKDYR